MQILVTEEARMFNATGRVIWVDSYRREEQVIDGIRIPARDNYRIGIKFLDIQEQDREEIKKNISQK